MDVTQTNHETSFIGDRHPIVLPAGLFQDNYLSVAQHGADPIEFPYRFVAPSNTGIASGLDLNNVVLYAQPGTQRHYPGRIIIEGDPTRRMGR